MLSLSRNAGFPEMKCLEQVLTLLCVTLALLADKKPSDTSGLLWDCFPFAGNIFQDSIKETSLSRPDYLLQPITTHTTIAFCIPDVTTSSVQKHSILDVVPTYGKSVNSWR